MTRSDEDDIDIPDEGNNFMVAEIPLLMGQTIEWINKRATQKRHDENFLKRFKPNRKADKM